MPVAVFGMRLGRDFLHLLLALGIPLWAARQARGPLASTALAAYVAWLAHAAVDWDWQIPAVTLPALACGAALVACAPADSIAELIHDNGIVYRERAYTYYKTPKYW